MYYDEPTTIQCLGGGVYNEVIGFVKQVGDHLHEGLENSMVHEKLDYISGACMLVKADYIEEVGFLAEDYFLYFEELDWCIRGRKKGWSIDSTNKAIIYHKVGGTINTDRRIKKKSVIADYYSTRSKLLYASKYSSIFANVVIRIALLGVIFNRVYRGQYERVIMILRLCFAKY